MSRKLEIAVISAEDLRVDRRPVRRNAFVVVKIDPFNYQTTRPDEEGGSYPSWNEKFEMDMQMSGRGQFVSIEVFCRNSSGAKKVGSARMPVTDFMGGYAPEGYVHFLSYRLRDDRGDRNGIVNVSVRVKVDKRNNNEKVKLERKAEMKGEFSGCSSQAAVGIPPSWNNGRTRIPARGYGERVVTGVPASWCTYPARG